MEMETEESNYGTKINDSFKYICLNPHCCKDESKVIHFRDLFSHLYCDGWLIQENDVRNLRENLSIQK